MFINNVNPGSIVVLHDNQKFRDHFKCFTQNHEGTKSQPIRLWTN